MGICRPHANEIPNYNRNTTSDDEQSALPGLIGIRNLDYQGNGTKNVKWDGQIVRRKGVVSRIVLMICLKLP